MVHVVHTADQRLKELIHVLYYSTAGLTRYLACGRAGIAESVLGKVEVSRGETS